MLARGLGLGLRGDGFALLFESDGDCLCEGNVCPGAGRVRLPHLSQRTANPLHITREKCNQTASPIPENRSVAIRTAPGKLERLLTVEEVAQITGLSVETLNQWRSQRRGIPFVRLSRNRVRYRQSDLDEFIEANTIAPVPVHPSLRGR
jgi:excisionase family DNA binding protein